MKEVVEVRVKNFKELEDAILKNMFDMRKKRIFATTDAFDDMILIPEKDLPDWQPMFIVHFNQRVFFLPTFTLGDKTKILNDIEKISKKWMKPRRMRILQDYLDSLWQDACRDPLKKIPCLIYQNMSDKRKNGKAGRELKNHLQKFGTEAMISSIRADNVVALKELLELCDVGYAALNITFQTECKNTSPEIRACMLDAMEKQRMVDKGINISQICMQK